MGVTDAKSDKVLTMHPAGTGKPLPVKTGDQVIAWFCGTGHNMLGYRGHVTAIEGAIVLMELINEVDANGRKVIVEGQMTIDTAEEKHGRGRIFSHFEAVGLEA